jgi:multimeric flavodoxin WrbA
MRVVAFNGSPRRDGNPFRLIRHLFAALEKEGVETELVPVGGNLVRGCTACFQCFKNRNSRCVQADNIVNGCIAKMRQADGIVPGSCYWNMGVGRDKGDVEKDEEGLRTMTVLGDNMAWLMKKVAA